MHTALTLAVKSPAVGEIIKGAVIEVDELSVLYQDSLLLSFSSRREQSCHVLALWIGLTPSSSSLHIFSHFSTAALMTWCRKVVG